MATVLNVLWLSCMGGACGLSLCRNSLPTWLVECDENVGAIPLCAGESAYGVTFGESTLMRVSAIITARGGSKQLPRKNIALLAGIPLVAYSIQAACKCPLVDAC